MSTFTLRLGPLEFRTTADSGPTEALGNAIDVVGAALTSADPAPKPFGLVVPVGWAGRDADAYEQGLRARRQVRSLLNNAQARMQGLYFSWDVDPDLNGWLIVGGGDLEPGDAAGITTGEWKLTLRDCYVAGRRRTHRRAVQAHVADRRLSTTPRDILGTLYGTAFALAPAEGRLSLPIGAQDVVTYGDAPLLAAVETRDGDLARAVGTIDGQVLSFEQDERFHGLADVLILDRQGSADEGEWEAVYGPDQALTAGDMPVVDNGRCRVRWDDDCLALDAWGSSAWVERGRVPVGSLLSAHVVEWTPERAVVAAVASNNGVRTRVYVTVQRGWNGPAIELYAVGATLRFVTAASGRATYRQATSGTDLITSGNPLAAGTVPSFSGWNWAELSIGGSADGFAVLRSGGGARIGSDSSVYGTARSFVDFPAPVDADYTMARFALGVTPGVWVLDTFASDSISSYTVVGSGLAIGGGVLTFSSTTIKTLLHNSSDSCDHLVSIKFTTGASVASWGVRTIGRASGAGTFLSALISHSGALQVVKQVAGVDTALATLLGANLVARTTYWLVLRTGGDGVGAELWTTDPAAGGTASRSVYHTLSSSDLVAFPAASGRSGIAIVPGGTDWTADDFGAAAPSSAAMSLGFETLVDTRAVPTLVART